MSKQLIYVVLVLLFVLFFVIFSLNFFFLNRLTDSSVNNAIASNDKVEALIRKSVRKLQPSYLNKNPRFYAVRNKLIRNMMPGNYVNASVVWEISQWWPKNNEIYPALDTSMGQLLRALQREEIITARNAPRGTQLKLLLYLTGKQKVIFKPKWYEPDEIITGVVYSGKDRHRAEIFSFYLGVVLNMRWTPIVVGRKINLQHIYEKADQELRKTFIITEDQTRMCFYGKCHYCKESEAVCGDAEHMLEGAILQLIPGTLSKYRSPWQRTYKDDQKAEWEYNMGFCTPLKNKLSETRLLDLIDVAIFDFLIQNGDRHHYETRMDRIVLVDNGKGFGNPNIDYMDILAPLYQCCIIRKSTWDRLVIFSGGVLSEFLDQLTKADELHPLLTDRHLKALERRLKLVYSTVEYCLDEFGNDILIV